MEPGVFLTALLIFVGIPALTVIKVARLRANRTQSPSADVTARLEALERSVQELQREQAETTGTNKEISVTSRSKMKRLLKEPLLHFLVLGALA